MAAIARPRNRAFGRHRFRRLLFGRRYIWPSSHDTAVNWLRKLRVRLAGVN